MTVTFEATQIEVGFHPDGYRIDKTTSALNRYTRWEVLPDNRWVHPTPVCFDSLPPQGWFKVEKFNWKEDEAGSIG